MQAVLQETSLVIAGAWNPAILTPPWIMAHSMQNQEGHAQMVQAVFPALLNGAFDAPRFTLPGFTYTARNDAVIFLPEALTQASLNTVEDVAAKILTELSHTPIGGVGHNFEFRHAAALDEWLEPFNTSQTSLVDAANGWDVSRTTLATSFVGADSVAVNIQRYAEGDALVIKFNFHHSVTSAPDATRIMTGDGFSRFWENYQTARRIVEQLYGEIEV